MLSMGPGTEEHMLVVICKSRAFTTPGCWCWRPGGAHWAGQADPRCSLTDPVPIWLACSSSLVSDPLCLLWRQPDWLKLEMACQGPGWIRCTWAQGQKRCQVAVWRYHPLSLPEGMSMAFSVFFFRLSLVGDPTALNVIPGVPLSPCGSPRRPAHRLGGVGAIWQRDHHGMPVTAVFLPSCMLEPS